ncbi:nucleophosmin-like [Ambystoma mexicanum]|uniref:nucleophosmin-like n=1 Tax=Ambystoma mexicanum TaxID=8296 RepID=UPI0037E7C06B
MEARAAAEESAAPLHTEAQAAAEESETPLHVEARAAAEESETPLHVEARAAAEERTAPLHTEAQAAAEESAAPLHTEARAAAEKSEATRRTHNFPFGCVLDGISRKVSFPGGGDDLREQLTLRTASLGPGAPDVLHVLEVEGETRQGLVARVPVATLRPSLLTSVYLGGLELTPPVTFWLTAGTGPLYISGQHLVALTESDAAASRASAVREAVHMDAAAEREAEQTLALEQMKEKLVSLWSKPGLIPVMFTVFRQMAPYILGTDEPLMLQQLWEFVLSEKLNEPPAASEGNPTLTVEQMKEALRSSMRGRIPGALGKFRKLVRFAFRLEEPLIVQHLWGFVVSEKLNKPSATRERNVEQMGPYLNVEQMKEKLVSLSKRCGLPTTMETFRNFADSFFHTHEPRTVQQLWEFVLSEKLNEEPDPMTVEQMKESLVSLSLKRDFIPETVKDFHRFVCAAFRVKDPRIVQQLWEFVLREKLNEPPP